MQRPYSHGYRLVDKHCHFFLGQTPIHRIIAGIKTSIVSAPPTRPAERHIFGSDPSPKLAYEVPKHQILKGGKKGKF